MQPFLTTKASIESLEMDSPNPSLSTQNFFIKSHIMLIVVAGYRWAYGSRSEPPSHIIGVNDSCGRSSPWWRASNLDGCWYVERGRDIMLMIALRKYSSENEGLALECSGSTIDPRDRLRHPLRLLHCTRTGGRGLPPAKFPRKGRGEGGIP
ncbi:hypothetical protein TNCV_4029991 [Trichonephila clavipes]|nr:hypothetical protein TNCV_4029991 [Trichonephila clavipes]